MTNLSERHPSKFWSPPLSWNLLWKNGLTPILTSLGSSFQQPSSINPIKEFSFLLQLTLWEFCFLLQLTLWWKKQKLLSPSFIHFDLDFWWRSDSCLFKISQSSPNKDFILTISSSPRPQHHFLCPTTTQWTLPPIPSFDGYPQTPLCSTPQVCPLRFLTFLSKYRLPIPSHVSSSIPPPQTIWNLYAGTNNSRPYMVLLPN